ncbi:MAG: efflux transporter outer membrane subunit [Myxococcota bacterium]
MVLGGFFLAGCAVGRDYRRPELNAPARWNRLDDLSRPEMPAGSAGDLSEWWRNLDDPLLSDLVKEALLASPDLRMAQARLREARARRVVTGSAQYPDVSASASGSRNQSTGNTAAGVTGNQLSAGFDASWELDVFGGVRRSVEAAKADLESSEASLNDTHVSLVAEVARDYFEVRSLQLRLGIARSNLASQSETLQLTGFRAQAGLVSSQDVEQAKSNRELTMAQIPSLKASLAEAEYRLDVLLGKAPGTLHTGLDTGGSLPAVHSRIAVGIPADTLRRRPDVRAAERNLAAATARVGVAEAARYPSFKLSGSIGVDALVQSGFENGFGSVYSLLGGITAPIFYGGRLRAQVEVQDAVREQALVAYEQAVLSSLQEVENALVSLVASSERADALTRAVEAARNAALLARQRYRAGMIDFQSVLDTERSVFSIEDSLASTRADEVFTLIRLYKALGGGWSPQADTRPADKDTP